MHAAGEAGAGSTPSTWATSHPSLHELARALDASPPDEEGLLEAVRSVEFGILDVAEHCPALVTAALVEAHRTGSKSLLGEMLEVLQGFDRITVPLASALAAVDEPFALECTARLFDPRTCLSRLGALTTVRVAAAQFEEPSEHADFRWGALHEWWSWPPEQLWQVLMVADARLLSPTEDLDRLCGWLFDLASGGVGSPDAALTMVFRQDPSGGRTPEVDEILRAHVLAFVEQAAAVAAAGSDVVSWIRWIGRHLPGCGERSCCRPSRFEAELSEWGFHARAGRTPWT